MTLQKEMHALIKVLIVEDEPMVSEIIRRRVEELGYAIAGEVLTGLQAVEMTQSLKPDVILMDIAMPGMNGIEATRRIYQTCPTPVVIMTAFEAPDLVKQASQVGAGAYLIKMPESLEIERAITIAIARFDDMMKLRHLNAELQNSNEELQTRNKQLQAALEQVKLLSGLLPVCANCKNIRDDKGYWQEVTVYIRSHSEAKFSHGVCPDCMKELYPELYEEPDDCHQMILTALDKVGWINLEDIVNKVDLSKQDILNYLQNMIAYGQIRETQLGGQNFYRLP